MSIKTNLNDDPYFDDFDPSKQYNRILFRPSRAVQARELTQIQSILQDQIEKFGSNIYKEGSIIQGVNLTQIDNLYYVKLTDYTSIVDSDGNTMSVVELIPKAPTAEEIATNPNLTEDDAGILRKYTVRGRSTGLVAEIIQASEGFESRNPDLKTLYVTYIASATNAEGQKQVFDSGEILDVSDPDGNEIGTVTVTSFSGHSGRSYGVICDSGVVFQRGVFAFVEAQSAVVSKYNNRPDNVSVGFDIVERIVTSGEDPSLLDNAQNFNNRNAPGADRLKVSPVLSVYNSDAEPEEFFSLIRYRNGLPVTIRATTQFNSIEKEIARRTYDESGDYIVSGFKTSLETFEGTPHSVVEPGKAYIKGFEVQTYAPLYFEIDPVATTTTKLNQQTGVSYGNYFVAPALNDNFRIDGTRYNLKNDIAGLNTVIGTCSIRSVEKDPVDGYRIYVYAIEKSANHKNTTIDGVGDTPVTGGIQESSKASVLSTVGLLGVNSLSDITFTRRRRIQPTIEGSVGQLTIYAGTNTQVVSSGSSFVVIDEFENEVNVLSTTTAYDGELNVIGVQITLETPIAQGAVIYYDEVVNESLPDSKVSYDVFVNTSISSDPAQSYKRASLGLPDAYKLLSVTGKVTGTDYTNDYVLVANQKDGFYDISYIELKTGASGPKPDTTQQGNPPEALVVKFKVFKRDSTIGAGYLTIDSYTNVEKSDIPTYTANNGEVFDLASTIDFRPYAIVPGMNYAISEGGASTAPSYTDMVNSTSAKYIDATVMPSNNSYVTADIEHYVSRKDVVIASSSGEIKYIKGTEADNPKAPITNDSFVLAEIFVPSNPVTTRGQYAAVLDKRQYVHGYTMKEIARIDRQVARLTNFMQLSILEMKAKDALILDANGNNRFKNGFIVDNFRNLKIADITNPYFKAGIDKARERLTPAVQQFPVQLKRFASNNVEQFDDVITLATSNIKDVITQPYATNFRNCVSNFYKFIGTGEIFPNYDSGYDVTYKPDFNIDIDLETPFADLIDNIQEFVPLTRSSSTSRSSTNRRRVAGGTRVTTTTVTNTTTRSLEMDVTTSEQRVGEFVTDVSFRPYMEAKQIRIVVHGLRPSTRHYVYFDEDDMSNFVFSGMYPTARASWRDRLGRFTRKAARSVRRTRSRELYTDAKGTLYAVLNLPGGKYFVGERSLEISDSSQYNSIHSAGTSYAKFAYNAYNFDVEKAGLTVSTRSPDFRVDTTRTRTTRSTTRFIADPPPPPPQPSGGDGPVNAIDWSRSIFSDPLAQTFIVTKEMAGNKSHMFLQSIDVFFKTKSQTQGITLEIREVINGYPTFEVLPFGSVHLESKIGNTDIVLTSDNGQVATRFEFDNPVQLATEKEYAFVLLPDGNSPDYNIWTSKVGEVDLFKNVRVVQDWGQGVLFTSTNNRAWKSYQDEDAKFILRSYEFSTDAGYVEFVADDMEFLSLINTIGNFTTGEAVYTAKGSVYDISVTPNSDNFVATSLDDLSGINEADYVIVKQGSQTHITRIVSAEGTNNSTLTFVDPAPFFGAATIQLAVGGEVSYYNPRNSGELFLKQSSANDNALFENGNYIIGAESGATAVVGDINDVPLSYFQVMFYKTNVVSTSTEVSLYNGIVADKTIPADDAVYLNANARVIESKSNLVANIKDPDFRIRITLNNGGFPDITPIVDDTASIMNAYKYKLTSDDATSSNYVSTEVVLQDGLPASGLQVFMDAHRPAGTNINMYVRFKYIDNEEEFTDWILLNNKSPELFTSSVDIEEIKEFQFEIPEAQESNEFSSFQVRIALTSGNVNDSPYVDNFRAIAVT